VRREKHTKIRWGEYQSQNRGGGGGATRKRGKKAKCRQRDKQLKKKNTCWGGYTEEQGEKGYPE